MNLKNCFCGEIYFDDLSSHYLTEMWKDDVKFGVVAPFETRAYGAVLATIAALHTQVRVIWVKW